MLRTGIDYLVETGISFAIYDLRFTIEAAEANQKLKIKMQNCGVAARVCFIELQAAEARRKTQEDRSQHNGLWY